MAKFATGDGKPTFFTMQGFRLESYVLGRTVGVGTFGKVKLAVHEKTKLQCAVKIINKQKTISYEMFDKLRREINIFQAQPSHPHLVTLFELIDTPTDVFVVMEFVPGGELFDYIVAKGQLSENEARRIFQELVSGVDFCHTNRVCHRDIKPENLLLDANNRLKIGDFGLSNFMTDGDFLKTSCGSPNYASPEVVSGKPYAGPEVDVWSCGVVLFALLCSSLPFDDGDIGNLFKKIRNGSFSIPSFVSDGARHLLLKMLVVDVSKRIKWALDSLA